MFGFLGSQKPLSLLSFTVSLYYTIQMGRLVLFDRVIDMAPDDIYLPAFLSLLFRLVWYSYCFCSFVLGIRIPLSNHRLIFLVFTLGAVIIDSCISTDTVGLFLIASTILLLVLIINEFILIKISMSGTISDPKPRENIGVFAHLHFVLVVLEVVVQAFGFYVIYDPIPVENLLKCTENAKIDISLTLVRIVIFWSFVSAFIYFVALSLFVWGSKAKNMVNKDWNDYLKLWKRRIEWFLNLK
ncbi:hypothetical protein BC833DRAFT_109903 [Globomyces pollinis-pini]|nr:hypothetical protein BC833DRAFT_109903 [Globomyces pollinis-pini]